MKSLALAALALLYSFCAQASSFQELNGVVWFYSSLEDIRFRDIEARLPELERGGIRVLGIYSPYRGDKEKWRGCDPLDFYATHPPSGSLDDFRSLVRAAHARGMKVVAYFTHFFLDRRSPFFQAAERQYAQGDFSAREASAFRWTKNPKDPLPLPNLSPGPQEDDRHLRSQWLFSDVAKAWYWSQWGEAAFDFSLPGGKAEVSRALKFWLDTGLDGFMFDAAQRAELMRYHTVELLTSYTRNDKWITFESTNGEEAALNHEYGLTSWFNHEDNDHVNDYSLVVRNKISVDELETNLRRADHARRLGKTTHAWAKWDAEDEAAHESHAMATFRNPEEGEDQEEDGEDEEEDSGEKAPYPDPARMRAQEAALLAGAGILFGAPISSSWDKWPAPTRAAWLKVLSVVNANPALRPSGARARVPVEGDRAFAMKRVSRDGAQAALLVYNFENRARTVTVSLDGSGIALSQQPVDLLERISAPAISGVRYSLELPAYGFRFLGVKAAP